METLLHDLEPGLTRDQVDRYLEWFGGALPGIAGALIMASRVSWAGYAYPIWLISSISLTVFGIRRGYYGLVLLQSVFIIINCIGSWRWLFAPWFGYS